VLVEHAVDCVIHFAGSTVVPDSVSDPLTYYANNTVSSRELICASIDAGVQHFIFSSTAAVYGATERQTLDENAETSPANPYGRSKLATEWILQDAAAASSMRYVALRYFNVAGADPLGRTGQSTPRATHLIKRACQAALGQHSYLEIFGVDFPTHDGTGVRDYIHVSDLVSAHLLALEHLRRGGDSAVFNCGYGRGFSVREVICAVEAVSGRRLETGNLVAAPEIRPPSSRIRHSLSDAWAGSRSTTIWAKSSGMPLTGRHAAAPFAPRTPEATYGSCWRLNASLEILRDFSMD
jgi:UDP-glucose 4-epimerase